jgi:hypothetical protein
MIRFYTNAAIRSFGFRTAVLWLTLCGARVASAQSNIDPNNKFTWSENLGFINWFDAGSPPGNQGVVVYPEWLGGFAFAENAEWINLGDGDPGGAGGNETAYLNMSGDDFGVNRDPQTGELSGFAWSATCGWVNVSGGAMAAPPDPARIVAEGEVCRLRGYAWAEAAGWINLDDDAVFVAAIDACCEIPGDVDGDGDVDQSDLGLILGDWGCDSPPAPECPGDADGDGDVDQSDLGLLLSHFGEACP